MKHITDSHTNADIHTLTLQNSFSKALKNQTNTFASSIKNENIVRMPEGMG